MTISRSQAISKITPPRILLQDCPRWWETLDLTFALSLLYFYVSPGSERGGIKIMHPRTRRRIVHKLVGVFTWEFFRERKREMFVTVAVSSLRKRLIFSFIRNSAISVLHFIKISWHLYSFGVFFFMKCSMKIFILFKKRKSFLITFKKCV